MSYCFSPDLVHLKDVQSGTPVHIVYQEGLETKSTDGIWEIDKDGRYFVCTDVPFLNGMDAENKHGKKYSFLVSVYLFKKNRTVKEISVIDKKDTPQEGNRYIENYAQLSKLPEGTPLEVKVRGHSQWFEAFVGKENELDIPIIYSDCATLSGCSIRPKKYGKHYSFAIGDNWKRDAGRLITSIVVKGSKPTQPPRSLTPISMSSILTRIRELTKGEPEKTLYKAGFVDINNDLTSDGEKALLAVLFDGEAKIKLAELAKKLVEDSEK